MPDKEAGVASVVRNLLQFKTDRFATKVILLHNESGNENRRIKANLNSDNVVRIIYQDRWNNKFSILNKIQKELNDDSILVVNDGGISLDVIGLFNLNIPVVYIMHGDLNHYYKVIAAKAQFIGKIITISDFLYRKLSSMNLNLPIESLKFPVPNVSNLKRTFSETIRLVFVGSLIKTKGVYDLVEIVKCLESNSVNYSLNIIGQGVEEASLKNLFHSNHKVRFLGQLLNNDVLSLHSSHDVILLPSVSEGMGMVLIEAMKCGVIPIVTNLKSGIPELIDQNENGYLVDLGDHIKYCDYIISLTEDLIKRKTMSTLCIEKANLSFDANLQTIAYEEAFATTHAKSVTVPFKSKIAYYIPFKLLRVLNK